MHGAYQASNDRCSLSNIGLLAEMQDTCPSTLSILSEYFHHSQEKANSLCFLQEIVTDMNMQCIFLPGTVGMIHARPWTPSRF